LFPDSEKNNVLIFAPYFPPRLRVGAIRPYRFAKYLSRKGWNVSVISIKHPGKELNETQKKDLENVSIFELAPPFDNTTTAFKQTSSVRSDNSILTKIGDWVDSQIPTDTWWPFFWSKKKEINDIIDRVKPDIIWSTSDPWSGGYVIGKIAVKKGIPWVSDFRDPWTLCSVRFTEKGFFAQKVDKKLEKWIINNSDFMTFTSLTTEQKYVRYYNILKGRTTTIYNSFDSEIQETDSTEIRQKDTFDIYFLGSFRELSTAELIINTLSKVKEIDRENFDKIFVHSYGDLTEQDLSLSIERGVRDRFITRGKVAFSKVQHELHNADLLLLSTHPERNDIVPAKLWDYLLAKKNILSLVQNPEVSSILESSNTGKQFDKKELNKAAEYILEMQEQKRNPNTSKSNRAIKISNFDAPNRALQLSKVLNEVIKDG
jgi:glycosyltransferase involved in cell wall biosynthesis